MSLRQNLITISFSAFQKWIFLIFFLSLSLRFWQLGQFNQLVFDEVYYAKFANNYLIGKEFFNSHPPLSQYLIALGIWLGSLFPASPDSLNDLTGSLRSTVSYRWFNAFWGAFVPLIVAAIAYQLTKRRRYALIAAIFASTDGLFLVESRYALNNIYLVIFGLLGQLFFLRYCLGNNTRQYPLFISGICFGSAAAIKWNGLSFLLGIYGVVLVAKIVYFFQHHTDAESSKVLSQENNPWHQISQVKLTYFFFSLLFLPIAVYSLLWIPHLILNPEYDFWQIQKQIFVYHQSIGNSPEVHPYCSPWYSWIILWRPIAYYYQVSSDDPKLIYDVHAMGNPVLWWLSSAAIFYLLWMLVPQFSSQLRGKINLKPYDHQKTFLWSYILLNYAANLLPWVSIKRCTFLYHYMGSYVFSWLALAWSVEYCLAQKQWQLKCTGLAIILAVIIAFIFWLPIYLGIPLSPAGFKARMLFPNWI